MAVAAFLEGGEPPIVWTPGSAMRHGRSFFEVAIEACRRLDRRGLLLTRYPEQLPARLLDGICHADYVPLSQVLRRSAALVHHGGIGTLAQGLAAGVPQLVMPMAHDQPDNAIRLRRLGCGVAVKPSAFRAPAVTEALHSLLTSPDVARSCQQAAERIAADRPLDLACDIVERLLDHPQPRTVGLRHKD